MSNWDKRPYKLVVVSLLEIKLYVHTWNWVPFDSFTEQWYRLQTHEECLHNQCFMWSHKKQNQTCVGCCQMLVVVVHVSHPSEQCTTGDDIQPNRMSTKPRYCCGTWHGLMLALNFLTSSCLVLNQLSFVYLTSLYMYIYMYMVNWT